MIPRIPKEIKYNQHYDEAPSFYWPFQGGSVIVFFITKSAFYVNLYRAVIGPSG